MTDKRRQEVIEEIRGMLRVLESRAQLQPGDRFRLSRWYVEPGDIDLTADGLVELQKVSLIPKGLARLTYFGPPDKLIDVPLTSDEKLVDAIKRKKPSLYDVDELYRKLGVAQVRTGTVCSGCE